MPCDKNIIYIIMLDVKTIVILIIDYVVCFILGYGTQSWRQNKYDAKKTI